MVSLSEGNIKERGRCAGVDHREGRKLGILEYEVNGKNNMLLRVKTNRKHSHRVSSRGNNGSTEALRAKRKTQGSALYSDWVSSFPGGSAVTRVASETRAGRGDSLGSAGQF